MCQLKQGHNQLEHHLVYMHLVYIYVQQMQVQVEIKVNQKQSLISNQLDQLEHQLHDHNQLIVLSLDQ
jgi:hypothetical protein